MTAISYIGTLQNNGTVLVPPDAQEKLGLQPGDEVQISLDRSSQEAQQLTPNQKARLALQKISMRQEGRRTTDGSQTEQIIREGRAGGMYDDNYLG